MAAPRVLIADDHPLFRRGLRSALELECDVVAEAEDGVQAVADAVRLAPDVVVMDVNMPRLDGIEATRQLVAARPGAAVLVLTMADGGGGVLAAIRAGARGYLDKVADPDEILRAVHTVHRGEAIFGRTVASRMAALLATSAPTATPFPELTPREREILHLVAAARSNAAIADQLCLSEKTVRNYLSSIFAKIGVTSRAQAIVRVRDAQLPIAG